MSNTDNKTTEATPVFFRAIDRYVETNIVPATETKLRGKDRIMWGDQDKYPAYILSLYRDVATLGSIVNGCVDYAAGNAVTLVSPLFPEGKCNRKGELAVDVLRGAALDYFLFGGFALEVIRGRDGDPVEIYNLDMEDVRTNEDVSVFWWSDKWDKGARAGDITEYPAFMPGLDWARLTDEERDRHAASVLYVKNSRKQVYPMPPFAQAVKACETERSIDVFHLNSIKNGFSADVMVTLCNGNPPDTIKEKIERDFREKFAGETNAGRMMLTFSPDRQHAAVVQPLKVEDFGNRYEALASRCRQQIFTSFRANENLFGIPTAQGFNSEEYAEAFKLFNRTQIQPAQQRIADAFDRICGQQGVLTIIPFSLEDAGATIVQ